MYKEKLPYKFSTYLHGSKEDEAKYEVIEELDAEGSELEGDIIYFDYEVKIDWEISKDGKLKMVGVDGKRLVDADEYESFIRNQKIDKVIK